MISHDFTIILGVREKNIAYPCGTKNKFAYHYAKFSQALGGPKNRTPQLECYAIVFRVVGTKYAKSKVFSRSDTRF